jgi:FkbM family methyltransferase
MIQKIKKLINTLHNLYNVSKGRKFPFRSILRFILLQLYFLLINKKKKIALFNKLQLYVEKGSAGSTSFFYFKLPDYEEMSFMLDNLSKGDLFVDIGSNIGGWSLLAAGNQANVIAIEPVPSTYSRLLKNIQLNPTVEIQPLNIGVSSFEGNLKITTDNDTMNKILGEKETYLGTTHYIPVTTIDKILEGKNPAIIKVDVEGHELEVIKGMLKTLSNNSIKGLIIETFRSENNKNSGFIELENILKSFNFLPFKYNVQTKELELLKNKEGGQNTIYVRKYC